MIKGKPELKLFVTFLFLTFFFVQWYGWNEESRFSLTKAIVNQKRFEIDSFANLTGDRAVFNGHYYSDKDPGLSFLATPIFASWRFLYNFFPKSFREANAPKGVYITELHGVPLLVPIDRGFFEFSAMILLTVLTSGLFASLTTILVFKLSKLFLSTGSSVFLAFAYGIATLSFPTSLHFWSHSVAAFFSFLGFYLIFSQHRNKWLDPKLSLLAGLMIGFAIVVEISIILIAVGLLFYLLLKREREKFFLLFLFGLSTGILPYLLYNLSIFGKPFDLPSSYLDREIYTSAYPLAQTEHSATKQPEFLEQSLLPLHLESLLKFLHFQSFNPWIALRLLFYPYRGLFFYSPLLLLSLIGIFVSFRRQKAEIFLILFILISFLLMVGSRRTWWGGYAFGPRYLMPVVPFLMLPLIATVKRFGTQILLPLFLLSLSINFIGLQPAEDVAYDWSRMDVKKEWLEKQNSFEVIYNPIVEHYLPGFVRHGPRSAIFEHLSNGYISIDPRPYSPVRGPFFPFSKFFVPFLSLFPPTLLILLIWHRELITLNINKRNT